MNVCACIERLVPNAKFQKMTWTQGQFPQITEEMYNGIIWEDERTKPTWLQLKVIWLEICKETLYTLIENERDHHLSNGFPYMFPGDVYGVIQTRHIEDQRNIQINHSAAQTFLMLGLTEQPMTFRDTENVIHTLTPIQMVEMTLYVSSKGQHIYTNSWIHKDIIKQITIIDETDEIEINTKINDVLTYDYSTGWQGA